MNPFRFDSPVMQFLAKMADLIILNVLTLILSLPVFTIGAAVTALHSAVDKLFANEGKLLSNYFHAFAINFKQATVYWLLLLLLGGSCGVVLLLTDPRILNTPTLILCIISLVLCCLIYAWIFPLQATFRNKTLPMIRNAVICALSWPIHSVLMALLDLVPLIILIFIDGGLFFSLMPLWLGIWVSGSRSMCRWMMKGPMLQLKAAAQPPEEAADAPAD